MTATAGAKRRKTATEKAIVLGTLIKIMPEYTEKLKDSADMCGEKVN